MGARTASLVMGNGPPTRRRDVAAVVAFGVCEGRVRRGGFTGCAGSAHDADKAGVAFAVVAMRVVYQQRAIAFLARFSSLSPALLNWRNL